MSTVSDASSEPEGKGSRGIQSIEVGSQLLVALVHLGRPSPLKDLAREAGMSPAKAHPYLVSFGKVGLIQQDASSGHYGLGPLALQVGLISLQQVDPVRLATPELPALARAIGHTVGISILGNRGPTFVRVEEGPNAIHVNMKHGTVASMKGTASGVLFGAYMPREELLEALRVEAGSDKADGRKLLDAAFESELKRVRDAGFSRVTDGTLQGITAMSAPVFDGFGSMVLAVTAIGPTPTLEGKAGDTAVRTLRAWADALSARLGARPGVAVG